MGVNPPPDNSNPACSPPYSAPMLGSHVTIYPRSTNTTHIGAHIDF